jgi:hypothetical protein
MMSDLQELRESFKPGEEVLVVKRPYGPADRSDDAPGATQRGWIDRKESAFAVVVIGSGPKRSTQKIPYKRLRKVPKLKDLPPKPATRAPKSEPPPPPLRAVPSAFSTLSLVPPPTPEIAPPPPASAAPPPQPETEFQVWLKMGESLLDETLGKASKLRKEAAALADQAQSLMDQSDAKLAEADLIIAESERIKAIIDAKTKHEQAKPQQQTARRA